MDISSITSSTTTSTTSTSVAALEKQKAALEKKITDEKASEDEDKVKDLKIAQYNQQIAQIEASIKLEKAKANKNNENADSKPNEKTDDSVVKSLTSGVLDESV